MSYKNNEIKEEITVTVNKENKSQFSKRNNNITHSELGICLNSKNITDKNMENASNKKFQDFFHTSMQTLDYDSSLAKISEKTFFEQLSLHFNPNDPGHKNYAHRRCCIGQFQHIASVLKDQDTLNLIRNLIYKCLYMSNGDYNDKKDKVDNLFRGLMDILIYLKKDSYFNEFREEILNTIVKSKNSAMPEILCERIQLDESDHINDNISTFDGIPQSSFLNTSFLHKSILNLTTFAVNDENEKIQQSNKYELLKYITADINNTPPDSTQKKNLVAILKLGKYKVNNEKHVIAEIAKKYHANIADKIAAVIARLLLAIMVKHVKKTIPASSNKNLETEKKTLQLVLKSFCDFALEDDEDYVEIIKKNILSQISDYFAQLELNTEKFEQSLKDKILTNNFTVGITLEEKQKEVITEKITKEYENIQVSFEQNDAEEFIQKIFEKAKNIFPPKDTKNHITSKLKEIFIQKFKLQYETFEIKTHIDTSSSDKLHLSGEQQDLIDKLIKKNIRHPHIHFKEEGQNLIAEKVLECEQTDPAFAFEVLELLSNTYDLRRSNKFSSKYKSFSRIMRSEKITKMGYEEFSDHLTNKKIQGDNLGSNQQSMLNFSKHDCACIRHNIKLMLIAKLRKKHTSPENKKILGKFLARIEALGIKNQLKYLKQAVDGENNCTQQKSDNPNSLNTLLKVGVLALTLPVFTAPVAFLCGATWLIKKTLEKKITCLGYYQNPCSAKKVFAGCFFNPETHSEIQKFLNQLINASSNKITKKTGSKTVNPKDNKECISRQPHKPTY